MLPYIEKEQKKHATKLNRMLRPYYQTQNTISSNATNSLSPYQTLSKKVQQRGSSKNNTLISTSS